MKQLKDLLYTLKLDSIKGSTDVAVQAVEIDSRKIAPDGLFVALRGTLTDGHHYIESAVEAGAVAVVCEEIPARIQTGTTYVKVQDANEALAIIADHFYNQPSKKIKLVGVTGTNGKTTIASLLYEMFTNLGYQVGLLSTVKIKIGDLTLPATHTTPDSLTINRYLDQMVAVGCAYCFMEVSSHGIDQKRTFGLAFAGGVFTNLSHDHLDYHNSFASYRDVKKQFFDHLPKSAFALVNKDDKNGRIMLQNTVAKSRTYALKSMADYRAQVLENQFSGMLLKMGVQEVWVRLIGEFNAYNLLAVYAVAKELGVSDEVVLVGISKLQSVEGRFQYVESKEGVVAIVDYAHTPDALKNVIETINAIRTGNEKLITVIGCGGNRDKTKRPIMAGLAAALSNRVILTSDNPRFEDPYAILQDMEVGIEPQYVMRSLVIEDRKQAIKAACMEAQRGDIILIAGKGHESYQEIEGVRTDFNDLEIVKQFLETKIENN